MSNENEDVDVESLANQDDIIGEIAQEILDFCESQDD